MNRHLTEEQISKWIAGDSPVEAQRHVLECAQCGAKLASYQTALSAFRGSITHWADQQRDCTVPDTSRAPGISRQAPTRYFRWLAVTATVAVMAGIPAYQRSIQRQRAAQAAQESQLDAQLLERVNAHLSRTAPASLQPLMEMLSSNEPKREGERR